MSPAGAALHVLLAPSLESSGRVVFLHSSRSVLVCHFTDEVAKHPDKFKSRYGQWFLVYTSNDNLQWHNQTSASLTFWTDLCTRRNAHWTNALLPLWWGPTGVWVDHQERDTLVVQASADARLQMAHWIISALPPNDNRYASDGRKWRDVCD